MKFIKMKSTYKNYNTMIKKFIVTMALILLPTLFFGQSVFDKYEGQDVVKSVIVSPKMFQMMGNVKMDAKDKEKQQFVNLVKKLENLKVFTTSDTKLAADMKLTADKYIKSAKLEELMRANDKGSNIKIMVKSGSKETQVRELLMFIEGAGKNSETVLMSLTGNFDLDEVSLLTDKMNIAGGDAIKKATKK